MPELRLGGARLVFLLLLSALAFLPGLGSSGRLTYHEAFVAQGREKSFIRITGRIQRLGTCPGSRSLPCPGG